MSGDNDTPTDVVKQFNSCIAERDIDSLSELLSEDHVFTDSAGNTVSGKRACTEAWSGFFAAFPDYYNELDRVEEKAGFVAVAGRSVCSDSRLRGPALWKAVVVAGRIAEWHVLDDTEENRTVLGLSP